MNSGSYQDLDLREGASINEIKAAYRRLAKSCHPDAAGHDPAKVAKFIKAQSAYEKLMKKAVAHNQARRAASSSSPTSEPIWKKPDFQTAGNWRFQSSREIGLDVYYRIMVKRPSEGEGCRVLLPWQVREACPRCLGQGRTLAKVSSGDLYRPSTCGKCGGSGSVARDSKLEAVITPDMVGREKIRLRKAGLYNPKQAQRGDLTLEIQWVDNLPGDN